MIHPDHTSGNHRRQDGVELLDKSNTGTHVTSNAERLTIDNRLL